MIILYGNDESEDIYMKLMVASDIHGSGLFGEKLIEAYKAEKPDKLVLLGEMTSPADTIQKKSRRFSTE